MGHYYYVGNTDNTDSLYHWKYIKRYRKNGKWRYVYDKKKNIYDVSDKDYEYKKRLIMQTDEWKDIVRRRDPEYVYVDSNGVTQYRFDKYLLNKKHPVIDALSDITSSRKPSILKRDAGALIAGVKDYVKIGAQAIATALKVGTGLISAKIYNQQGSYHEQKKNISETINNAITAIDNINETAKAINKISDDVKKVSQVATVDGAKAAADTAVTAIKSNQKVMNAIVNTTASDVKKAVSDTAVNALVGDSKSETKKKVAREAVDYAVAKVDDEDIERALKKVRKYLYN